MKKKYRRPQHATIVPGEVTALAAKEDTARKPARRADSYARKLIPKAMSRVRSDVGTWRKALAAADSIDNPRRGRLMRLYEEVMLDALLSSQVEQRMDKVLSAPFTIVNPGGEEDDELRATLLSTKLYAEITKRMLEGIFFGHSLVELATPEVQGLVEGIDGEWEVLLLPRGNVVPEKGELLRSEDDGRGIPYRTLREYGTYILEFGSGGYGLINRAIPHVLFKRFAQACWSELCEIYGIPPRVMKTNTQDTEMLDRAESMMRDMGSAAYFIIDEAEEFEFAQGVSTNGDVYSNLIQLCNSELSMLITRAVVGQDTKNGNRSKEESSLQLLDNVNQSDKAYVAQCWNATVIPALVRLGYLPQGAAFKFMAEEDIEKLWAMTKETMPYMDVDPEWLTEKFGIKVLGAKQRPATLALDDRSFFG